MRSFLETEPPIKVLFDLFLNQVLILDIFYRGFEPILHYLIFDAAIMESSSQLFEFLDSEPLSIIHFVLVGLKVFPLNSILDVRFQPVDHLLGCVRIGTFTLVDEREC